MSFPQVTTLIDDFNRPAGGVNQGAGAAIWGGGINSAPNNLNIDGEGQVFASSGNGRTLADFGPDCEFFIEVPEIPASNEGYIFLAARIQNPEINEWGGYGLIAIHVPGEWIWQIREYQGGGHNTIGGTLSGQALAPGDLMGFHLEGNVMTGLWQPNGGEMIGVGSRENNEFSEAGPIGMETTSGCRLDNLRGGTLGEEPEPIVLDGEAELTGSGSLDAQGAIALSGAADLAGAGDLEATGSILFDASAALSGDGSLEGTGSVALSSGATLTGDGSITAEGSTAVSGSANLTGSGDLEGEGHLTANGEASLNGSGLLDGEGSQRHNSGAELVGTGTLAATGEVVGVEATYDGGTGSEYGRVNGSSYDNVEGATYDG
jgi:hypothetical protein